MVDRSEFETKVSKALAAVSGIADPQDWLVEALTGGSNSGVTVNAKTALGYPPLWGAVSKISGHIANMEIEQIRQTDDKPRTTRHHAYRLLNRDPCEFMTAFRFREMMQLHALLYGNGRAWVERNSLGQAVGLYPLPVESTQTRMIDGEKWHLVFINEYDLASNTAEAGKYYKIPDRNVLHIMGLTYTGVVGVPLLQVARDALGLGIAGQDATANQFRNNGRPGLILEAPRGQFRSQQDADDFMAGWNKAYEGVDNAGKTGLIREGMKAHLMPLSAADSQFLEQREFQRSDTALLFFNELLGDSSAAYKSLSEKNTAYINNCLSRWMAGWVQECSAKLLSFAERNNDVYRFKFDTSVLMAGDPNTLAEYTGKLRQQAIISGDEARDMHGLPPVGLTDDFTNPNTSSGDEAEPTQPESEAEADDASEVAARAIQSRFAALIRYELRRLKEASKRDGNFLTWCEMFYDRFQAQLAEACQELNLPESLAQDHCVESARQVLEITGIVDAAGLPGAIDSLTQDWPQQRAGEFAKCLTTT